MRRARQPCQTAVFYSCAVAHSPSPNRFETPRHACSAVASFFLVWLNTRYIYIYITGRSQPGAETTGKCVDDTSETVRQRMRLPECKSTPAANTRAACLWQSVPYYPYTAVPLHVPNAVPIKAQEKENNKQKHITSPDTQKNLDADKMRLLRNLSVPILQPHTPKTKDDECALLTPSTSSRLNPRPALSALKILKRLSDFLPGGRGKPKRWQSLTREAICSTGEGQTPSSLAGEVKQETSIPTLAETSFTRKEAHSAGFAAR